MAEAEKGTERISHGKDMDGPERRRKSATKPRAESQRRSVDLRRSDTKSEGGEGDGQKRRATRGNGTAVRCRAWQRRGRDKRSDGRDRKLCAAMAKQGVVASERLAGAEKSGETKGRGKASKHKAVG